ncbi:HAMP domain-containing sensor histidine kinase [Devosia sp. SD17-2]|uniref:sensor histidine kinase n=1 Tax=unclassified Devosia TaxID=196773 RepID=UPI0031F30586
MIVDEQNFLYRHRVRPILNSPINRFKAVLWSIVLSAVWLASFRLGDFLTFFRTYSSTWFLPSGVTLAIVLVAPGWMKISPLVANLLLAFPAVRWVLGVEVENDYEPVIHGIRLYLVYGGAALVLTRLFQIDLPFRSLRDNQWLIAAALGAATIATTSGIGLHILAGNMSLAEGLSIAASWWLGDAIGAIVVPPLLVPVLMAGLGLSVGGWQWPKPSALAIQSLSLALVLSACAAASTVHANFWYLAIIPILIFALNRGYSHAVTAVFLTNLLSPLVVLTIADANEAMTMAPLLLTASVAGLLIGAAISDRNAVLEGLEETVALRTQELEEAYQAQRHLVRTIGHDLRQPVEALRHMLGTLKRQLRGSAAEVPVEQARVLSTLASEMLTKTLTYARLDAGKHVLQITDFTADTLFGRLEAVFGPLARRKAITIEWEGSHTAIRSDEGLIFQVLANHLDNALRVSPAGASIAVSVQAEGEGIALSVSDAFEANTTAAEGAAGLGMSIIRHASTLLGGQLISERNRRGIIIPYPDGGS